MEIEYSKLISNTKKYSFASIDEKVSNMRAAGKKVVDFGVGDPSSPSPDFVIDALSDCARKSSTAGYPSYIGNEAYRKACANYIKREYNVDLDYKTEISSTVGSKESIFNFPRAFINPGDVVICPSPAYPVYKTGTVFSRGVPYIVPLLAENNFLIDFKSIPVEVAKKAKIIWTNYPNAPTGVEAPFTWLQELCDWAEENNIIIAADEGCYNDIYFNEKPRSILEIKKDGIITFYSLSKRNNMTGYRIGFVAGDSRIIEGFRKVKTNIDSGTPNFIQDVAALALGDTEHVKQMRSEYREKREILFASLKEAGFEKPVSTSTFFVWVKAKDGMSGMDFASKMVDVGIVVVPGSIISDETYEGVNPGEDYVRFALVPSVDDVKYAADLIKNNM